MTKELLEQYPDICEEIKELEQRLKAPVQDTVSGSSESFPYTQHPVAIRGIPPGLAEQRDRLVKQKKEIEAFVAGLPNSSYRRVVTYRALKGMSWKCVTAKMGGNYTERRAKNRYYEVIKNIK